MTLPATAPAVVNAGRDRFLESVIITSTLGLTAASFFYPRAPGSATLPAMVIERTSTKTDRNTNGGWFFTGTLTAVLYLSASAFDDGQIEDYSDTICQQICELLTDGLFVKSVSASRASDPSPGMFAGSDAGQLESGCLPRSIVFTIDFGDG